MRETQPEIEESGAQILVVGNGKPHHARAFREQEGIELPLYVDPELQAYRAAGLRRDAGAMAKLAIFANAARAWRQGFRQTATRGDPWQMGGTFVLNADGKTLYEHVSKTGGDHAPDAELLAALAG